VSFIAFTVDDVYVLDFDHPEVNGFGILAFKVEDIKSANGRFLYDKVKLILANGITDLADIPRIAGTIVLGGQAFHLAMPSIPKFTKEQCEHQGGDLGFKIIYMWVHFCLSTHLIRSLNPPKPLTHQLGWLFYNLHNT
jgi:hypothetical protein